MKHRKLLFISMVILLVAALSLGIVGCTTPAEEEEEEEEPEEIILKYGVGEPSTHFWAEAAVIVLDKIEAETDGRVRFEKYFAGTLINPRECFDELASGVADISALPIGLAPGGKLEVERALMGAYFGVRDVNAVRSISAEVMSKYPELEADWVEYGKVLGWSTILPFHLSSAVPVNTLEDFQGMTLRAWPDVTPVFAALGADSVGMPSAEVYSSLQTGVLDAATAAWEQLSTYRWAEVTEYHVYMDMATGGWGYPILMNWDTWNSLPPDIQQVFEDNYETWIEENHRKIVAVEQEGIGFATQLGNTFSELPQEELDEFYDLMDANFREIMADLDAKGYRATDIYNEIRSLVEEWES
jgi:TRAP-type C4-dicarboxylate transport system substrate-binding protein